ncbi:MAG: hypothetical protein AB8G23_09915 [Myxococcota bacterium]
MMLDYLTSGEHHYPDCEWLHPGESTRAFIKFAEPEYYPESLSVGQIIDVQEGEHLVGFAEVVAILNDVLQGPSAQTV